jgi:hypothetical protein
MYKEDLAQCQDEDGVDESNFLINLLPVAISSLGSLFENHLDPVFGRVRNAVLVKLEATGFQSEHLPLKIGGS